MPGPIKFKNLENKELKGPKLKVFNTYRDAIFNQKTDDDKNAILGQSVRGAGIIGLSESDAGVHGHSKSYSGVIGISESGEGVMGISETGRGLAGFSTTGQAIYGESTIQAGVVGVSEKFIGVWGESKSVDQPGVFGMGKLAARFDGNVEVTGDLRSKSAVIADMEITGNIQCTGGADCAEDFDIADVDTIEPGTVMVLGDEGGLRKSFQPYDKCVAGVISGAGDFKPGMVLDKQVSANKRQPVALLGKTYCKVDADFASIKVGDLLTSSPTPGHAMKATDITQAFGAVIGKALWPLKEGRELIPILITLQ